MKTRGFIIGLVIFVLSATAAYVIGLSRPKQKAEATMTSTLAMAIEEAMKGHKKRNEIYPEGTNSEIAVALRGERALAQDHLNILPFILKDGQLVDVWGNPFRIGVGNDDRPVALSPGPNGKFGDGDDVTSKEAKKTAKELEED